MFHSASAFDARTHLRVDGVSHSYAGRRVLTDISFTVSAGERVGLIGENGSGKSTLLRAIAGLLDDRVGTVSVESPGDAATTIGLLHQEPPFALEDSIDEALEGSVAPVRHAAAAVGELGGAMAEHPDDPEIEHAFARALDDAERLGAWEVDARIAATVNGLGLGAFDRSRAAGSLSGGQRARLGLACLLLSSPDVLLLDEPTNHLDDAATAFLVGALAAWRGPVLIASHDRAFLDETATSLIDLDPSPIPHAVSGPLVQDGSGTGIGAARFTGGFSDYLADRQDARARWERQYRDEQAAIAKMRASVSGQQTVGHTDWKPRTESRIAQKFYGDRNAKVVSRRVNDARGRLEQLEAEQIRKPPVELEFRGLTVAGAPRAGASGAGGDGTGSGALEPVLVATNVSSAERLVPHSLSISRGERWLITGPNGAGKSTLLGILAGRLSPDTGQVTRSSGDRVELLSQEIELADPRGRGDGRTVLQAYTDLVGERTGDTGLAERVPLTAFGLIAGRDLNRPVSTLSVGQQRRLALAVLLADPPEILLLDEPTNHFSLSLIDALETALERYPGTVVVASHDRWLRRRWSGERFEVSPE